MKSISYILVIYILFLSLASSIGIVMVSAGLKHGKHSCCQMAKKGHDCPKEKKDKDCCNDGCNPFMSCCNGCALASESIQLSFHSIPADQKMDLQKQNLSSVYLADAWHPPEFYLIS